MSSLQQTLIIEIAHKLLSNSCYFQIVNTIRGDSGDRMFAPKRDNNDNVSKAVTSILWFR